MGKVLVLGGTRYFGKRLVNRLLEQGVHEITVATRGLNKVDFKGNVEHLILDRKEEKALLEAARSRTWDIVFDNICYSPDEALAATSAFDGYAGRYVMTSTLSVYDFGKSPLLESDFNPYEYELKTGSAKDYSYGECKRLAEAAFFQRASFPVSAMRIPIVLGPDDYTRRLHFHVERVMKGIPIGIPNLAAEMSYITSEETANFMHWLGESSITGPINASSNGMLSMRGLLDMIEATVSKKAIVVAESKEEDQSPFGVPVSWVMDTSAAKEAGYHFTALSEWMPELIKQIATDQA